MTKMLAIVQLYDKVTPIKVELGYYLDEWDAITEAEQDAELQRCLMRHVVKSVVAMPEDS